MAKEKTSVDQFLELARKMGIEVVEEAAERGTGTIVVPAPKPPERAG